MVRNSTDNENITSPETTATTTITMAVPDAFLDTIPEDQSVAQQRVANLSAASAVASSNSDHDDDDDEKDDNDNMDNDLEHNPQRRRRRRQRRRREDSKGNKTKTKTSNNIGQYYQRRHGPGSVASSDANAIIGTGIEELSPSESYKPSFRNGICVWTRRKVVCLIIVIVLAVAISVGIYFIVVVTGTKKQHDENNNPSQRIEDDENASSPSSLSSSGVPTTEFTIPPNFSIELDSDSPSSSPTMDWKDIHDMDDVLLLISNPDDYLNDITTPQGKCRYWLTRMDTLQITVLSHGVDAIQQRYILCVLYQATNNPYNPWMDDALPFVDETLHECDWKGVSCDDDQVAVVLYLAQSNLQGTIPTELIYLSQLQLLSLGENELTGSIPQGLLELPELILIDLSSNILTGTIPSTAASPTTLNRYSPLETLYLDDNVLEGTIPFFDTLARLRVQRNLFTGFDPGYATLTSLTSWKMYDNAITGHLPQTWDAPYMLYIDLALNLWTGSIPDSLWNLPSLESLVLHDAVLTGTLPETTVSTHWKYLWLHSNQMTGKIPSTLGRDWVNLTELLLHNNSLTGTLTADQCNQWPKLMRLETDCDRPNVTCDCCTVCHA